MFKTINSNVCLIIYQVPEIVLGATMGASFRYKTNKLNDISKILLSLNFC